MSGLIVEEMCRLCLNDCFPMNNIFHNLSPKGSLYEVLNFVYNLEVSRDDGLPPNICLPCLWKLREFEVYKFNVHFAKKELLEIIKTNSVIKEVETDGVIIAGQENGSGLIIEKEVHSNAIVSEDDTVVNDVMDKPSEKLAIKSEIDVEETEISSEQLEIQKITEMEESTTLEHFHEMEIIPAVIEKCDSHELAIKSEIVVEETEISSEQLEIQKITEMEDSASLENCNEMEIIPAVIEKCDSQELAIKSEIVVEETEISSEQLEIQKITEMEDSASLENCNEMEIIPAVIEKCDSQECLEVRIRLRCHHCGEERDNKQEIAQHIEDTHNSIFNEDNAPHQDPKKDKNHMLIHAGEMRFQCNICNNSFSRKGSLKVHMRKHTGEKPFQCHICSNSFSVIGNFKCHMHKHAGEKPFQCNICNDSFSQSSHLKAHMQKHTGEKPFKCHICNNSFSRKENLKVHMRKHTGEKPFQCHICNNSFSVIGNFKRHMRKHTGEKPFQCNICNDSFSQSSHLNAHMQKHTGEKPFKCHICNNSFSRKENLKVHMRRHTGEKPFQCNICNDSFSNGANLKRHMRKHTGEKPFQCNICNDSFSRSSHLKAHMRKHTGKKPFQWDISNNSFSKGGSLKVHMRKHTGENPFQCNSQKFNT